MDGPFLVVNTDWSLTEGVMYINVCLTKYTFMVFDKINTIIIKMLILITIIFIS